MRKWEFKITVVLKCTSSKDVPLVIIWNTEIDDIGFNSVFPCNVVYKDSIASQMKGEETQYFKKGDMRLRKIPCSHEHITHNVKRLM